MGVVGSCSCAGARSGGALLVLTPPPLTVRPTPPLPSPGVGPLRPLPLAATLSTLALLPLLFIELRQLSRLSMLGAASTALVIAMVLALLGLDPQRAAMPLQVNRGPWL